MEILGYRINLRPPHHLQVLDAGAAQHRMCDVQGKGKRRSSGCIQGAGPTPAVDIGR